MIYAFILNPFPDLLAFSLFGATLLRVVAGMIFVRYGYQDIRSKSGVGNGVALLQLVGGAALILGFYTQIAVLVLFFLVLHRWAQEQKDKRFTHERSDIYILLLVICLSLLVTGAGFFALDLPL